MAAATAGNPGDADAVLARAAPSPLLAIDQNRATVVERIAGEWGDALVKSNAGIDAKQLRDLLMAMRADQLLAASLAGSLEGLRNAISNALLAETPVKPSLLHAKVLGDAAADLVYTPVTPCRLFDTRISQNGSGILVPNVVRTYSATAPVAQQGGPGGCVAPAGTAVAMIQFATIAPPALGLLQGGAHGTGPFANALILYQPGDQYGASIPMPVLVANGQFDLVAQFNGVEVSGDLLGYFKAPAGGYVTSVTAGTGLTGGVITSSGTIAADTAYLQRRVSGTCAAGSSIRTINSDGTVVCESDDVGTGTVTSLSQGTGITLSSNPITATGSIAADTAYLQRRVSTACAVGSSIRAIAADGSVTCQADTNSGGTVTSVGTGNGLTGGPIVGAGTINLATTQLLPLVACANGQTPAWNGSAWACSDPFTFGGNINLANSTSASVGNVMKGATRFIHNYGLSNTFVGESAGNFTMTGSGNSALGSGALSSNTSGAFNTAGGGSALFSNTTGNYNVASGGYALSSNATGAFNTATGHAALSSNTTGFQNTASGGEALVSNTTGINNTAGGFHALYSNVTGQANTAHGAFALFSNTTDYQTAVGANALYSNTTGPLNTAIGANALYSNTTGQSNVAAGVNTLRLNTIGVGNTAIGNSALGNNDIGVGNAATGGSALLLNTSGSNNVANGNQALRNNQTGHVNTAVGLQALATITTGSGNTAVGAQADTSGNFSNATAIGSGAIADASNHVRIGDANVTQIGGQVAWSSLSDRRGKKDIAESSLGLDFVKALRPVQFKLLNGNDRIDFGFVAQEVEALVGTQYNVLGIGGTAERKLSLRYTDFIAPMVKAMQEQQKMIEAQSAEIEKLRRAVEMLLARVPADATVATLR